ncbi:hypothetical protein DV733_00360 [Halapricum salinum]|uniref:Uncharacterized protein n=1 Tax=Halapricum salinum TaxID=1457250 RepID=A0A4D6H7S6_9EURY|nr:hypothetical protein DV733_00360 [Halapricum salinum]
MERWEYTRFNVELFAPFGVLIKKVVTSCKHCELVVGLSSPFDDSVTLPNRRECFNQYWLALAESLIDFISQSFPGRFDR